MIGAAELAVQRMLTKEFIEADVLVVTLIRATWVSDGGGGSVRTDPQSLSPQRMRLIPLGDGGSEAERMTSNGEAVRPAYKLLGRYTADMERWDEVVIGGSRYEIVFVNENRQYEVKGEVAYRGGV